MIIGTAGFHRHACVMALEEAGIRPDSGEIVVTGASGGVGSTAVTLLQVGVSGRLPSLAAKVRMIICVSWAQAAFSSRDEFAETRPLEKQVQAGAVDASRRQRAGKSAGAMNYGGCVAACGLAGGFALPTTVMPFILRNVRLQGVDSVMTPAERRAEAWERLVQDLPASFYEQSRGH